MAIKHNIPNDDGLHMVFKEIQQFRTKIQHFRTEHADLKHKVDCLYEITIVNKVHEVSNLKENVDILYGKLNMDDGKKRKDAFVPSKE